MRRPRNTLDRKFESCVFWFFEMTLAGLLLSACVFAQAQASQQDATISFTLNFPGSIPEHYQIMTHSDGRASYDSSGKLTPDADADPFHLDFQLSPATRTKIFDLSARAKFFEGKVDSGKKNLASTGDKTLAYKDAQRSTEAHYNYSPIVPVQEITSLFQGMSTTLEFGRRLAYYRQYQKLALDDELKRMDEMNRMGSLAELQAIAPILKEIIADTAVINVSRSRAQRLLAQSAAGH